MPRVRVGGGGHLASHHTFGMWSLSQRILHINNLELLAVYVALQLLVINKFVVVMTDGSTVVGQIRIKEAPTHNPCTARLYTSLSGRTAGATP